MMRYEIIIAIILCALGAVLGSLLVEALQFYQYEYPNIIRIINSNETNRILSSEIYWGVISESLKTGGLLGIVLAPACILLVGVPGVIVERKNPNRPMFVLIVLVSSLVLAFAFSNRLFESYLFLCLPIVLSAVLMQLWFYYSNNSTPQ